MLHFHSNSTDSRHSMTPLDTWQYGSFSYPGQTGLGCGSITPATSVAGSQQVTSSMWQLPRPFSPALLPAMDTLSTGQVAEIHQLATECQALGVELTKQFQNLSGLEAVHRAMAQATAHKTINVGCMAHNAAFSAIAANQPDGDHKKFLHQSHVEADQVWKDTNDVIFSHQLKYDAQLAAFITTAKGTLQAKQDKIWSHIHSIIEVASLPNKACLTLALQILDKLPTLPLDLSYHTAILRMLVYCLESYVLQAWSTTGDGDYQLDNNTQAASVLSLKLAQMAGGANLDGPNPSGAASLAGSAVPYSPMCSPSHSHSRTPTKGEGGRSWSSSTSSLFSRGTQPESPAVSIPDEGSNGSSASEDDSESNGKDEAGSDDRDSDSSGSSDDECSSSSESGSEA